MLLHLANPPPCAMPPIVCQSLLVTGPFRELRILKDQPRRPETAIPPAVPVSWVLPPVAKLLGHLLLAHLRSFRHILRLILLLGDGAGRRQVPHRSLHATGTL